MSKAFRGEKDHSKGGVINHNIERTKKGLGDKSLPNLQATNEIILCKGLDFCSPSKITYLKLDASVAASWNFGGLLLVQVNEFATGSFGDAPFVTQRGVRHPTAKAKSLNHDYS